MKIPAPTPLPTPSGTSATAGTVSTGQLIPPVKRIQLFSDSEWEEFIWEWADSLADEYESVENCGGAGDMGRDVIAMRPDGTYDNYQCKHYEHPLRPTDIWVELGKLVYYTQKKAYSPPTVYYFVAPRGVGTKLANLLRKPQDLRTGLKQNWSTYCENKITSTGSVQLKGELLNHLDQLDFSIFRHLSVLRVIDAHRRTSWHATRFGGGLPPRPKVPQPPAALAKVEAQYVRSLLDAYSEYIGLRYSSPSQLGNTPLRAHFDDARLEFYSAESLREFSRDQLPPGEFEKLQEEIQSGIMDEHRDAHSDGYRRVLAVVRAARQLNITYHALATELRVRDRGGICHQLANDGKLKWVLP